MSHTVRRLVWLQHKAACLHVLILEQKIRSNVAQHSSVFSRPFLQIFVSGPSNLHAADARLGSQATPRANNAFTESVMLPWSRSTRPRSNYSLRVTISGSSLLCKTRPDSKVESRRQYSSKSGRRCGTSIVLIPITLIPDSVIITSKHQSVSWH